MSAEKVKAAIGEKRMMKVTVLQMQCDDKGNKQRNMNTFRRLVDEALVTTESKDDGCYQDHLVLGPECCICGYSYDYETCWKSVEPQGGPTERFLCELSKKYGIYLGLTYLEAAYESIGENAQKEAHIYNTFALAGPDGTIKGRVSKNTPCSVEAYLFTSPPPSSRPKYIIECDGKYKFAVLICYENFVYESVKALQDIGVKDGNVDLILQHFSGPLADDQKPHIKESLRAMYLTACPAVAKYMNCPALYCNKVGKWKQPSPSSFLPMTFDTEFPGSSTICDHTGNVLGRLNGEKEGILTRIVSLGSSTSATPSRHRHEEIPYYWGGFTDGTPFLKVCHIYQWLGKRSYQNDERRKKMAEEALQVSE